MPEIKTVAIITAKPGSGDDLEAALKQLAIDTRAEEACILYNLQRGLDDRNRFVTVEKWASKAGLDAHLTSPHVTAALTAAAEWLAEEPLILATESLDAADEPKTSY